MTGAVRLAVCASALALAACGGEERAPAVPEGGSGFRLGGAEGAAPAPVRGASRDRRRPGSNRLPMALERAAAQLLLVGFDGTQPRAPFFARLARRGYGAVALSSQNFVDPAQLAALAGEVAVVADGAGHPPPLVVATLDVLPGASSRQLREAGVHALLGPPLDLGVAGGPWEGRALGDDPASVASAARTSVGRALAGGVAPIPGHFPGEGAASQDPADGTATVGLGLEELTAADMRPFAAVARDAPAVQMSGAVYAAWDGVTPATQLPAAIGHLRERIGFRGAVVSADLGTVVLTTGTTVAEAAIAALAAGCDLLWVPGDAADQEAARAAIVRAVRSGRVPVARVADALRQVTALQRRYAPAR